MTSPHASVIVVGVTPGQPDAVVQRAAVFAGHFDAELVCAWVDGSRYRVSENPDGSVVSLPLDPDFSDTSDRGIPQGVLDQLTRLLDPLPVRWSTRELAGDPAHALGRLADRLGAHMIVVGTREAGLRGSAREFFNGSTALHLAHRQHRPVVVIPLKPVDTELTWGEE
ncbi:universal stress protein [Galbitalea soli]|uniref:Universal stress protein n=1 Tax=Galbitalea soli TaxID=1268042 RepID=A0A7C9TR08_9MICO|nr:universal stress protein [Galbitalea soli]NEM90683.1 universal stress protein [Galbitalea soli]NYJ31401.1 nucleotide-binding universal stress UspA family protein [Galbitalea soli]